MTESHFPHHSGGVVQVQYVTRYGSVPEALLEDIRLDLDSRAVAAWLAVKPSGWQISVTSLRMRLSLQGKKMLGKDRWQRIALELESAGYLFRRKVNGKGGQWVWHITFNPVPASLTVAVSDGSGSATRGSPADGMAGGGQPGYKVLTSLELPIKKTTTTGERLALNSSSERHDGNALGKSSRAQDLTYPTVTARELIELQKLMLLCSVDARQNVLDEIEGIRQAGGIRRGVVPLAKILINKVATGEFSLSAGFAIGVQLERRRQNKQAVSVAMRPCPEYPLRGIEDIGWHDGFEGTFLLDPHVGRVHHPQLFELKRNAVVDVVADVFLVGQHFMHCCSCPLTVEVGAHRHAVQSSGDFSFDQSIVNKPAVHLIDDANFIFRPRHQDDAIGLQTLAFTPGQFAFDGVILVNEHSAQPIASGAALAVAKFNQPALPGEHLGR